MAEKLPAMVINGRIAPTPIISMSETAMEINIKMRRNLLSCSVRIEKSFVKKILIFSLRGRNIFLRLKAALYARHPLMLRE